MAAGTCQSQGVVASRFDDPSNRARAARHHVARSADVPLRLWANSDFPASLSDSAGNGTGGSGTGAVVPLVSAGRIDAPLWQPAHDLSAGRALALQCRDGNS